MVSDLNASFYYGEGCNSYNDDDDDGRTDSNSDECPSEDGGVLLAGEDTPPPCRRHDGKATCHARSSLVRQRLTEKVPSPTMSTNCAAGHDAAEPVAVVAQGERVPPSRQAGPYLTVRKTTAEENIVRSD